MSILNIFQKNSKYFFNPVYTRQLSSLETTMELLNQRAKTWNLVTISRIRGYIHKPVLREALDLLQYRHLVLNSHIVTHQHNFRNRFYLQTGTTEKIPLRAVINSEEKEWQEVVNHIMTGAAFLYRIQNLKIQGLQIPDEYTQYIPEKL